MTNRFLASLLMSLVALAVSAQTTRIKDITLTDTQANSGQWIVTDDTSDNLTKKMTLSTLFGGWSGGVALTGSPLTAETLTLKGSALNDGKVFINPNGGDLDLGSASSTSAHLFRMLNDGSAQLGILQVLGAQTWGLQATTGIWRIRDLTGAANVLQFEVGADADSFYIDADGHVGFGANPTATNNFIVTSTDTTFLAAIGSTGTNAVTDLRLSNDAQTWTLQVDGGNGDRFEIWDTTGGAESPLIIEAGASANTVYIDNGGNLGVGTPNPVRKLHVSDTMRLEPSATAPLVPSGGDIYYDTSGAFCGYDGVAAAWVVLGGAGSCV